MLLVVAAQVISRGVASGASGKATNRARSSYVLTVCGPGHVTSLSFSFLICQMGTRGFPLQGYCEDHRDWSVRKRPGQSLARREPSPTLVVSEGQGCGALDFK